MRMASHSIPAGQKKESAVTATSSHGSSSEDPTRPDDRGWRLPAERTEEAVTAAALQMLSDRGALASTLKTWGLSAAELKQAIEAIDSKVRSFRQIGTMEESETIIERVDLKRDGMQITLNLRAMLRPDQIPHGGATLRMTRVVPMQMQRRGVETRLVIPGEAVAASRTDPALLRALVPRLSMVWRVGVRKSRFNQTDRGQRRSER